MDATLIVIVVVVTALVFDFTNGFHDTANAMATSIATGSLRPRTAVALAGCLNVLGAFLSVQVAKTVAGGLVDETLISPVVIFAGTRYQTNAPRDRKAISSCRKTAICYRSSLALRVRMTGTRLHSLP